MRRINPFFIWSMALDRYLSFADQLVTKYQKKQNFTIGLRFLTRVTFFLILLALFFMFYSCTTPNERTAARMAKSSAAKKYSSNVPKKDIGQFYIQEENIKIQERQGQESFSGSIWADSDEPRTLYGQFGPQKPGEIILVNIPKDLQYSKEAADAKDDKNNRLDSKASGDEETLKSLRFKVVSIDNSGNAIVSSSQSFETTQGQIEERQVVATGKILRKDLNKREVDATALNDMTVYETKEGQSTKYQSPLWNKVVSRKLSGFDPDLANEMKTLDKMKTELKTDKKSLDERRKALDEKEERIRKEQARAEAKDENLRRTAELISTDLAEANKLAAQIERDDSSTNSSSTSDTSKPDGSKP